MVKINNPVIREEAQYNLGRDREVVVLESSDDPHESSKDNIVVRDLEFGIVIPKIRANASIIADVDSSNPDVYQRALTQGIAHASGTHFPGEGGNIFLFSHSSVNFFEASRYNSIFYLLGKLEDGDDIYIYRDGVRHTYSVYEKKTVSADEVDYMYDSDGEILTLMTCWPAGTSYKRLIVRAKPK